MSCLALQSVFPAGLGLLLLAGCAPSPEKAHPADRPYLAEQGAAGVVAAPPGSITGSGVVDYEHAKPLPLPSLPDPEPKANPNDANATPANRDHAPAHAGSGQQKPERRLPRNTSE